MALNLKHMFVVCTITGLLLTPSTFANTNSILNKSYELIHKTTNTTTEALIYNGEIYVNLSDLTNTIGLSTNISGQSITLTNNTSTDGTHADNDGNLYTGAMRNGMPHGLGTRYLKDGGKYEGQWVEGVYEGEGTLVLANGNIYVGEFSKGFIHGDGKMFYPDGSYYKGHYEYGIKEGFGLLYVDHDNKYEGYWENGLRNGKGKAYIDGRYKKGLWENNQLIKTLSDSAFDF